MNRTDHDEMISASCHKCGDEVTWSKHQDKRGEVPACGRCGRYICVTCDCDCNNGCPFIEDCTHGEVAHGKKAT